MNNINTPANRHIRAHKLSFVTITPLDANVSTQKFLHFHALLSNQLFHTPFAQALQSLRHKSTQVFYITIAAGQNTIFLGDGQILVLLHFF